MIGTLPHNKQLESHFIGQTLIEKRIIADVSTSDFYDSNFRAIWAACIEADGKNKEIEPFSVLLEAKKYGLAENYSVADLTKTMVGLVPFTDFKKYADKLKAFALRRYLMRELANRINELETSESVNDVIHALEAKFDSIKTDYAPKKERFVSLAEIIESEVKPALDRLRRGETSKISTGFEQIDKAIGGGLSLSDVLVVGADTGAGKSAFVLQLSANIAGQGIGVAFLSCEMTDEENGLRILSQQSRSAAAS